jgi:hypothetical protein
MVPARRNPLILLFLAGWLVGWCFGEANALRELQGGSAREGSLFLTVWLILWTLGGVFAVYAWLWTAFGKEIVSIQQGALAIKREVLGFGRSREYDLIHIKRLRVAQPTSWSRNGATGSSLGRIAFDYGAKTIRFAGGVDETEALTIISELRSRQRFDEE